MADVPVEVPAVPPAEVLVAADVPVEVPAVPPADVPLVAVVLVSHSAALATATADLLSAVVAVDVPLVAVGGTADGRLGTDVAAVAAAVTTADRGAGVVVVPDLGSSVLSARLVLDDLAEDAPDRRVAVADAPFVEGGLAAAVTAATGAGLDEVVRAAEQAREIRKIAD